MVDECCDVYGWVCVVYGCDVSGEGWVLECVVFVE